MYYLLAIYILTYCVNIVSAHGTFQPSTPPLWVSQTPPLLGRNSEPSWMVDDPPPTGADGPELPRTCFCLLRKIWWNDLYCVIISAFLFLYLHRYIQHVFVYHTQFWCNYTVSECVYIYIHIERVYSEMVRCGWSFPAGPGIPNSRRRQQKQRKRDDGSWKAKFGEGWNFLSNECFFLFFRAGSEGAKLDLWIFSMFWIPNSF